VGNKFVSEKFMKQLIKHLTPNFYFEFEFEIIWCIVQVISLSLQHCCVCCSTYIHFKTVSNLVLQSFKESRLSFKFSHSGKNPTVLTLKYQSTAANVTTTSSKN
jgi:hypothetical protein